MVVYNYNRMNRLNEDLLFQIIKYCDMDEIINMKYVEKRINKMRLERLYIGIMAKDNFGINCIYNVKYYKEYENYTLNEYLRDILYVLQVKTPNLKPQTANKTFSTKQSSWYMLFSYSLNQTKRYWRDGHYKERELEDCNVCKIYRIPYLRTMLYRRRFGLNLLALIY